MHSYDKVDQDGKVDEWRPSSKRQIENVLQSFDKLDEDGKLDEWRPSSERQIVNDSHSFNEGDEDGILDESRPSFDTQIEKNLHSDVEWDEDGRLDKSMPPSESHIQNDLEFVEKRKNNRKLVESRILSMKKNNGILEDHLGSFHKYAYSVQLQFGCQKRSRQKPKVRQLWSLNELTTSHDRITYNYILDTKYNMVGQNVGRPYLRYILMQDDWCAKWIKSMVTKGLTESKAIDLARSHRRKYIRLGRTNRCLTWFKQRRF